MADFIWHYGSPLGGITLACDGDALTGLWFDGQKHFAETLDPEHTEKRLPVLAEAERWLDLYFSGRAPEFTPKLALRGTPFRKTVWEILQAIPCGETMTYGEIAILTADRLRVPRVSPRAVGGAVGHNPVSLIVPCHRLVGADGSLTGYAGGVGRKLKLLEAEKAAVSRNGRQDAHYTAARTV